MERQKLKKPIQKKNRVSGKAKVPRKPIGGMHVLNGDPKETSDGIEVKDKKDLSPLSQNFWFSAGTVSKVRSFCCWYDKLFITRTNNSLYMRDAFSVHDKWRKIGPSEDDAAITALNERIYSITKNGIMFSRNIVGPEQEWIKNRVSLKVQTDDMVIDLASYDNTIYALTQLGQIWELDLSSKIRQWRYVEKYEGLRCLAVSWFGNKWFLYGSTHEYKFVMRNVEMPGSKWIKLGPGVNAFRLMAGAIFSAHTGALFILTLANEIRRVDTSRIE